MRFAVLLPAALAVLVDCAGAAPAAANGPCDGRYLGLLTVKSSRGASAAEMQWTVRDTKLFGGFEGPSGLFMVNGPIDVSYRMNREP
jgi:hypothetical protein